MPAKATLEEFEPFCKWQKEGGSEVLLIYLNGFKKEQLKVQIKKSLMEVSGSRPVDKYTKQQFNRSFRIPKCCNKNDIKPEFTGGILTIKFPDNNSKDKVLADGEASDGSTSIYNLFERGRQVAETLAMVGCAAYVYKCCHCPYAQK